VTPPDHRVYDGPRIAAGYAFGRPPVHPRIVQVIAGHLGIVAPLGRALDVGCGAGVSTAALEPLARTCVGVEPVHAMLAHRAEVAPRGLFVVGRAERLPFADRSFELITAAGSINYTERDRFLPEAARLLAPRGVLVVYDFSAGCRLHGSHLLRAWRAAFEQRYPSPPGYALEVRTLDFERFGLRLDLCEEMDVSVPMTLDSYLRYAMSETNVELAIVAGVRQEDIEAWCRRTLDPVFGRGSRDVLFDAYAAYVRRVDDVE
jgi:SAM-dependent methyltransferase